jgi:pyrroline-5-carboxylate reductase
MHTHNIAIIGAGNMGSSLLGGLIANKYPGNQLWISNPSLPKLSVLQAQHHVEFNITTNNIEAANAADVILLTVKPLILPKVLTELAETLNLNKPLIISTAAGVNLTIIEHFLSQSASIVRAMPNTPSSVGCGASALFANSNVTSEQREIAENIFRAVGIVAWLTEEKLIDVVTAVSGSGPAYFFLIMEAIQNVGVSLGLTPDIARLLTLQTAYGAARMALESEKSVAELRAQVTSKGGTTEEAIKVLEQANIRDIFSQTLNAANHRAQTLASIITKEMES